jgi:serine/threonine protein kinase
MEYVAGRSLEEILSAESASLPLHSVLQLTQEVAEALDYAHLQGVVHRDVKPSNILVGEDGHAKIADFGIAQLNVSDPGRPGRTWGTPAYMSPEQFTGKSVDGRSDLFSLGVILYRMLTGHRPFQGNSALTVSLRVANQEPVPATAFNTQLPPELDRVIARAIAKDPAERYQSGMEMVLDLQRLRDGIELASPGDAVLPQGDNRTDQAIDLKHVFFSPSGASNGYGTSSLPPRHVQTPYKTSGPVWFSRPWHQPFVGFLTLGCLGLTFAGIWLAIPGNATSRAAHRPSNPPLDTQSPASIVSHELTVAGTRRTPVAQLSAKTLAREVYPNNIHPSNSLSLNQSRSCQLGIAVEHHFLTADLSIWIDDQRTYSHSLRGAIKKRVVLFKGVEGYLSDVVQLDPGEHIIRVRVLSADGSYEESGSIAATFAPGNEKLLAVDFDKHNRRMRLTFQTE